MPLLDELKKLGITLKDLETLDAKPLQTELAPILRVAAIQYLQNGQGVVAKGFRESYRFIASKGGKSDIGKQKSVKEYLESQEKDGVFGTYIEAAALGELLGCHVRVTPVQNDVEQPEFCLHKVATKNGEQSPTVHLYCANNNHWYIDKRSPKATLMNGNCLYNAFVLALRNILRLQMDAAPIASRLRSRTRSIFAEQQNTLSKNNMGQENQRNRLR